MLQLSHPIARKPSVCDLPRLGGVLSSYYAYSNSTIGTRRRTVIARTGFRILHRDCPYRLRRIAARLGRPGYQEARKQPWRKRWLKHQILDLVKCPTKSEGPLLG